MINRNVALCEGLWMPAGRGVTVHPMRMHLQDHCAAVGFQPEWPDVILDLNRLQEARLTQNGNAYVARTEGSRY